MAVPDVDKKLLSELQAMGFPLARATRALHHSGNSSLEDAVNWIIDHESDPDIDEMPLVPMNIAVQAPDSFDVTEEVKMRAEELRNGGWVYREEMNNENEEGQAEHESRDSGELRIRRRKSGEEREKELEREREKERIRSGKQLVEAKRVAEENARKRMISLREAEKVEERRARERIRQKLEADKAERRSRLGLPASSSGTEQSDVAITLAPKKATSATSQPAKRAELLADCLRALRRSCKGDDAKALRAFQTLHIYVRNVLNHPDEPKFRRIRLRNPAFHDRVGSLRGGTQFLELCGFEKADSGRFLLLPRDKVDVAALNSAMSALNSAVANPFFGLLSVDLSEG